MSASILPFRRTVRVDRADGVFAAVNIMARRMGLPGHAAMDAAIKAKQQVLAGKKSGARVFAETKAAVSLSISEQGGACA